MPPISFLAALSWKAGNVAVHWQWFALFWVVLTFGELFILPTGIGLFARLAPQRLGATTVASWFLATFAGNLAAGLVGTLWTRMSHPAFFALLAAICALLRHWTAPDGRPRPPGSRARLDCRPIPVDNSLIRTLVSVSEYSWPIRAGENDDDSVIP